MTSFIRVFTLGSPLSREIFARLNPEKYKLALPASSESLISIYHPLNNHAGQSVIQSSNDTTQTGTTALTQLTNHSHEIDLVIWDLANECRDIYLDERGRAWSPETEDGILPAPPRGMRHLPFGSPGHLNLWAQCARQFMADLKILDLFDKTILLAIPPALFDESGSPVEGARPLTGPAHDIPVAQYHSVLAEIARVELPAHGVRSALGAPRSPHRYSADTLAAVANRLDLRFGQLVGHTPGSPPSRTWVQRLGWDKLVDPWVDAMPIRADRIPSAYRIWLSAKRYLDRGEKERSLACVQLIKVLHNSYVPAEALLGEGVEFGYGGMAVILHPLAEVGDHATIGAGTVLGASQKPSRTTAHGTTVKVPLIGAYAYIGAGAKILGGVRVGPFAIVGPNAVVTRDVPPGGVVVGSPAKITRVLNEESILEYRATFLTARRHSDEEFLSTYRSRLEAWLLEHPQDAANLAQQ